MTIYRCYHGNSIAHSLLAHLFFVPYKSISALWGILQQADTSIEANDCKPSETLTERFRELAVTVPMVDDHTGLLLR